MCASAGRQPLSKRLPCHRPPPSLTLRAESARGWRLPRSPAKSPRHQYNEMTAETVAALAGIPRRSVTRPAGGTNQMGNTPSRPARSPFRQLGLSLHDREHHLVAQPTPPADSRPKLVIVYWQTAAGRLCGVAQILNARPRRLGTARLHKEELLAHRFVKHSTGIGPGEP